MKWADSAAAVATIELLESERWDLQEASVHRVKAGGTGREPDAAMRPAGGPNPGRPAVIESSRGEVDMCIMQV